MSRQSPGSRVGSSTAYFRSKGSAPRSRSRYRTTGIEYPAKGTVYRSMRSELNRSRKVASSTSVLAGA
jgi:hypothetical protein